MRMVLNPLHNFISPVTGKIPIPTDYVLIGDDKGFSSPSPIIIDIRLDMIRFRYDLDISSFIIGFPNKDLPSAQVLEPMGVGFMFNTSGVVSTVANPPFAPIDATYVLNTPNALLTDAQALSDLSGGMLKSSAFTGIISIASGGGSIIFNDYVDPLTLQIQILETKAFATSEALAAELAANLYFTAAMLPFLPIVPIPLPPFFLTMGGQISAAIAVVAVAAAAAHTRISNLNLTGDVTGHISSSIFEPEHIKTTFAPDPVFTGGAVTLPSGDDSLRPIIPAPGMIRATTAHN